MAKGIFETVADRVNHHVGVYQETVKKAALGSVVRVTIPGTPQKAQEAGSAKPRKADVRLLAQRVQSNILGSGALPSAVPNQYGEPVNFDIPEGAPAMPLVVNRSSAASAANVLRSGSEVVSHIRANTEFVKRKSVRMRVRKAGSKTAFTTARAWREAAKTLKARAGNFVSGWAAAAERLGSNAVQRTVQSGGRYDYRGGVQKSTAEELEASNAGAPSADLQRYQREVLDKRLKSETRYYAGKFLKYMVAALKKDMRRGMR